MSNKRTGILWISAVTLSGLLTGSYYLLQGKPAEPSPPRIGIIMSGDSRMEGLEGLQDGLVDLGYVLSEDLILEIVNADNDRVLLSELVEDLVATQPELLVALGGIEAEEAKRITSGTELPVIFVNVASPLERGLIDSKERSGNNLTGIGNQLPELIPLRLEMLTRILPNARKVLAYYSEDISVSVKSADIFLQTGQNLGLETHIFGLKTIGDLVPLIEKLRPGDVDVIFQLPSAPIRDTIPGVLGPAAVRLRIPILSDQLINT